MQNQLKHQKKHTAQTVSAPKRQRGKAIKAIIITRQLLKMGVKMPGLLFKANRGYRQFKEGFVQSAIREGLPVEIANQLAKDIKPSELFKQLPKKAKHEK